MAGSILIDRKSEKSRKESFRKMNWALRIGLDMVIYPEGTRNRTNDPLKIFMTALSSLLLMHGSRLCLHFCSIQKDFTAR